MKKKDEAGIKKHLGNVIGGGAGAGFAFGTIMFAPLIIPTSAFVTAVAGAVAIGYGVKKGVEKLTE